MEVNIRAGEVMPNIEYRGHVTLPPIRKQFATTCAECGRVFDMFDATDAEEWSTGHDCEN